MWCLSSSSDRFSFLDELGNLVVLQQPQVLGDDLLGRRALEAQVPHLQREALLQVARGDADRIEALDQPQDPLDLGSIGHGPMLAISSTEATR